MKGGRERERKGGRERERKKERGGGTNQGREVEKT